MNEDGKGGDGKVEDGKGADKPIVDAFGVDRNPDGSAKAPDVPVDKKEEGAGEGEGKKKDEAGKGGDDIEKNPVVVALRKELTDTKAELGGNLSGQREKIEKLEGQLADFIAGKKPEGAKDTFIYDPATIKRVKDLPADEQEEMTETEKKQMDELADMKEKMNQLFAAGVKKETEEKKETETTVAKLAQQEAKALAGDDTALANAIIANFNKFSGNDKLTPAEVKTRIEEANRMRSDYTPPKEGKTVRGKAAGGGDGKGDDPFGNNAVIEEAKKGRTGAYQL